MGIFSNIGDSLTDIGRGIKEVFTGKSKEQQKTEAANKEFQRIQDKAKVTPTPNPSTSITSSVYPSGGGSSGKGSTSTKTSSGTSTIYNPQSNAITGTAGGLMAINNQTTNNQIPTSTTTLTPLTQAQLQEARGLTTTDWDKLRGTAITTPIYKKPTYKPQPPSSIDVYKPATRKELFELGTKDYGVVGFQTATKEDLFSAGIINMPEFLGTTTITERQPITKFEAQQRAMETERFNIGTIQKQISDEIFGEYQKQISLEPEKYQTEESLKEIQKKYETSVSERLETDIGYGKAVERYGKKASLFPDLEQPIKIKKDYFTEENLITGLKFTPLTSPIHLASALKEIQQTGDYYEGWAGTTTWYNKYALKEDRPKFELSKKGKWDLGIGVVLLGTQLGGGVVSLGSQIKALEIAELSAKPWSLGGKTLIKTKEGTLVKATLSKTTGYGSAESKIFIPLKNLKGNKFLVETAYGETTFRYADFWSRGVVSPEKAIIKSTTDFTSSFAGKVSTTVPRISLTKGGIKISKEFAEDVFGATGKYVYTPEKTFTTFWADKGQIVKITGGKGYSGYFGGVSKPELGVDKIISGDVKKIVVSKTNIYDIDSGSFLVDKTFKIKPSVYGEIQTKAVYEFLEPSAMKGFAGGGKKSSQAFFQQLYTPTEKASLMPISKILNKQSEVFASTIIKAPSKTTPFVSPSIYAGLGLYERTEGFGGMQNMFQNDLKIIQTQSDQRQINGYSNYQLMQRDISSDLKIIQGLGSKTISGPRQTQKMYGVSALKILPSVSQDMRMVQLNVLALKTKSGQDLLLKFAKPSATATGLGNFFNAPAGFGFPKIPVTFPKFSLFDYGRKRKVKGKLVKGRYLPNVASSFLGITALKIPKSYTKGFGALIIRPVIISKKPVKRKTKTRRKTNGRISRKKRRKS